MNSQFIVYVQVFIAAAFVLWIVSRRGGTPKPTVLNLSGDSEKKNKSVVIDKNRVKKYDSINFTDGEPTKAKVLNVIFMWNGHSWDAYEVFGLPAGSSMSSVHAKFNELKSKSDEGQQMFLMEALKAIENKTNAS